MAEIIHIEKLTPAALRRISDSLAAGRPACLPTDTVYGLACLPAAPGALDRIYRVKGRGRGKPVALVFGALDEVRTRVPSLPPAVEEAMALLLPGPVTLVVPVTAGEEADLGLPDGQGLGVRVVPPPLGGLYRQLPGPLALTSANLSGGAEARTLAGIPEKILAACDFAIDAGPAAVGRSTTVLDLRPLAAGGRPRVVRRGAVSEGEILSRLGFTAQ